MKFYNRKEELNTLTTLYKQIDNSAKMAVITGRRRIGKTLLSKHYVKNKNYIYLFISKKTEKLLCDEFMGIIKNSFKLPVIGEVKNFKDVFQAILQLSTEQKIVLIIDEFQEFCYINPAVYSEIQNLWDQYKNKSKIQVIFIGSIYSLMTKIFQNKKEPLFGRADRVIYLKPFKAQTIKKILKDCNSYSSKNLFFNYLFTGGIPRYEEIIYDNMVFKLEKMIELIFNKDSPFINEGKILLVEEFGKEYGSYFAILELISRGKTSRGEMESILERDIGGYLSRLENDYSIITSNRPVGSKPTGRVKNYKIIDNFLNFWFRFIYYYNSTVEGENFNYLKKVVKRDIPTYSGPFIEKLFQQLLISTGEYNQVGNYWEKGNKNEIDIVAINKIDKKILFGDVKLNPKKININSLKEKSKKLTIKYSNYNFEYKGFSIENIDDYL